MSKALQNKKVQKALADWSRSDDPRVYLRSFLSSYFVGPLQEPFTPEITKFAETAYDALLKYLMLTNKAPDKKSLTATMDAFFRERYFKEQGISPETESVVVFKNSVWLLVSDLYQLIHDLHQKQFLGKSSKSTPGKY